MEAYETALDVPAASDAQIAYLTRYLKRTLKRFGLAYLDFTIEYSEEPDLLASVEISDTRPDFVFSYASALFTMSETEARITFAHEMSHLLINPAIDQAWSLVRGMVLPAALESIETLANNELEQRIDRLARIIYGVTPRWHPPSA